MLKRSYPKFVVLSKKVYLSSKLLDQLIKVSITNYLMIQMYN